MGFAEPDRSPGLLVSSYLTVSPLPVSHLTGGLLSVALSLTSRPVGVTHHRALRSPDFPPADMMQGICRPTIVRSTPVPIPSFRDSIMPAIARDQKIDALDTDT